MAENCAKCGAELFNGQRFCRACGNSTDSFEREEAPTQRMTPPPGVSPPPDAWGARGAANTGPTSKPHTNPVYAPPSYYQSSLPPMPAQPMPPYAPPRSSRSTWIPILALILLIAFGGAFFGIRSIVRNVREGIREGVAGGARSKEVVETQTFPLSKGATVSMSSLNGSITVQEWDQPQAEVKIIKRGNSDEDIQNTPVTIKNDKDNLSIEALQNRNNTDVRLEVKLPHNMGMVKFSATNGAIKLTDVASRISVESANGSISLTDVSGVEKAATTNGSIKAQINGVPQNRPMEFSSTNGSIDLTFNTEFDATLEASTVHGSIDIDEDFDIPVQKSSLTGARAGGQIGKGGSPLKVTTTNGRIKLSR
jgi:putative adhesin